MALVKAEIQNLDTNEKIPVCFNPKEYTLEKRAVWKEHNPQGNDNPDFEWTSGDAMSLHVELFFDTYEEEGDARDVRTFTDKIEQLMFVNADKHRPPVLLVTWGKKLQFRCVLTNLTQRFIMFLDSGTPVRAILNCVFREYNPTEEQQRGKPRHSADHTKRRVVKQGDTLSWIAGKEYGNPAEWRTIAVANGIEDPLRLTPGQELIIPPLY